MRLLNKVHYATASNGLAAKFRNCSIRHKPTAGLQYVELAFEIWPRGQTFLQLFVRSIPLATFRVRESVIWGGAYCYGGWPGVTCEASIKRKHSFLYWA